MRVQILTLALSVAALCGMSDVAHAQVDLSGEWGLRMHEDRSRRGRSQLPGEWQGCRSKRRR